MVSLFNLLPEDLPKDYWGRRLCIHRSVRGYRQDAFFKKLGKIARIARRGKIR